MKRYSISSRVLLVVLCMVVPLSVLSLTAVNNTVGKLKTQVRLMLQNNADVYMADLGKHMDNALSLLFYMQRDNSDCLRMLQQQEDDYGYRSARLKTYYSLRSMDALIQGGDGYFFYMKTKDDFLSYKKSGIDENREARQGLNTWLEEQVKAGNKEMLPARGEEKEGWFIQDLGGDEYLALVIDYPKYSFGAWIGLEQVKKKIRDSLPGTDCLVSFDKASRHASAEGSSEIRAASDHRGIRLMISADTVKALRVVEGYERLLWFIAAACIVLMPVFYMLLRRLLIVPLNRVREAHAKLEHGDEEYRITQESRSLEYQEVYDSFNKMAENLKKLRIEVYEKELERQKTELQSLQLQIRPHFLLNTFNQIFALSQRGEREAVQDAIIFLSDYFRYIVRSADVEIFTKELKILEGYRGLIEKAYEGRIEITFDFEPEISFVRIPPLLLMVFLENAVKHGLKSQEILHIYVSGDYEADKAVFWVTDDGSGIPEEELARFTDMFEGKWEPEEKNSHIGLYNSMKRLRQIYGDRAVMEADSRDGLTVFRIEIPAENVDAREGDDPEYEAFDRE